MKPRIVRPSDLAAPFPPLSLELRRLRVRGRLWLAAMVILGHAAMFTALVWLPGSWRGLGIFAPVATALIYSVLGSAALIQSVERLRATGAWIHWRMVPDCPPMILGELCVGAMRGAVLDWCVAWLAVVPAFIIPLIVFQPNGGMMSAFTFGFYMFTTLAGAAIMAAGKPMAVSGYLAPESESEGIALRAQLRNSPMDRQVWHGWDEWWDRPPGSFSSRSMAAFLGTTALYFAVLPVLWMLILILGVFIAMAVDSLAPLMIVLGAAMAFVCWYGVGNLNRKWLRWLDR